MMPTEKKPTKVFGRTRKLKRGDHFGNENKKVEFQNERRKVSSASFSDQYRAFRKSGLGRSDSFFNTFYIVVCEREVQKEKKKMAESQQEVAEAHFLGLHTPMVRFLAFLSRFFSSVREKKPSRSESVAAKAKKEGNFLFRNALSIVAVLLFVFTFFYIRGILNSPMVYAAEINGETVAYIENRNVVESAIRDLEDNVEIVLGEHFHFPYEVKYTVSNHAGHSMTEKSQLSETLYGLIRDFICTAGGLYVDDVLVAVCENKEVIEKELEVLIQENKGNESGDEYGILNRISILTQAYPTDAIISPQELSALLRQMTTPLSEREQDDFVSSPDISETPESSDNTGTIVPEMSGDMLLSADTQFVPMQDRIVRSNYPQSIQNIKLDFYTMRYEHYDAVIPYETVYVESDDYYTSMAEVSTYGQDGVSAVVAKVYFVEGKETRREIVSETVKRGTVTRVITLGIKCLPEEMGIMNYEEGRLILPRIGPWGIYSDYGWREEGFHQGIDIPDKKGKAIYAAASGTVVVAIRQDGYFSWRPQNSYRGYGYCVVIEHDNGMLTLYAHCSWVNVSLGQEVKQGDKIAEIGSTGDSDGNHVHFEVIVNNRKVNPHPYLYQGKKTIYDD